MPTDLEHDLRRLGSVVLRDSAPITTDEIVTAPHADRAPVLRDRVNGTPVAAGGRRHVGWVPPRRRPWLSAAAVGLVIAGVVALWATSSRPSEPAPAVQPDLTSPPSEPVSSAGPVSDPAMSATTAGDGALILDPMPDGWELASAGMANLPGAGVFSAVTTVIYATDSTQPETAPAFSVDVMDTDAGMPIIPSDADNVDIDGVGGTIYAREPGLAVSFETDGHWITITGYQVDRDTLMAAAEQTQLIDADVVIAPAGLPDGVVERATGVRIEAMFVDDAAKTELSPSMHWESVDGASMWLMTAPGTPETAVLGRIGAATVTDVAVKGHDAFITTTAGDDQYRSLTWVADGRIHLIGSRELDNDRLVELAAALRAPTEAEWNDLMDDSTPLVATIPAGGGLPEPGSVVPYRVSVFPVIDDTAVPNDGSGATYAYGTYSQAGIEVAGNRWIGAIGPTDWMNATDVVNVVVADHPELIGPTNGEPARDPAIIESHHEAAVELRTDVDGVIVQVTGSNIDELYDVITAIQPDIAEGRLTGYTVNELPNDLVDLTGPVGTGWEAGALPAVDIHNNALMMQVMPAPSVATIAFGGNDTERVDVAGRNGFLFTSPDTPYQVLTIEIDDHTSLVLTSATLTRTELLDAANRVELVDQMTWETTYAPMPAIIPKVVDTPATTQPTTTTQ